MMKRTEFQDQFESVIVNHGPMGTNIAKELGFSVQYISDLRRGARMPSVRFIKALTSFLRSGVDVKYWHRLGARTHGWEL